MDWRSFTQPHKESLDKKHIWYLSQPAQKGLLESNDSSLCLDPPINRSCADHMMITCADQTQNETIEQLVPIDLMESIDDSHTMFSSQRLPTTKPSTSTVPLSYLSQPIKKPFIVNSLMSEVRGAFNNKEQCVPDANRSISGGVIHDKEELVLDDDDDEILSLGENSLRTIPEGCQTLKDHCDKVCISTDGHVIGEMENDFQSIEKAEKSSDLPSEKLNGENESISLQNESFGLQNESLSLQNEPVGLQNEPISLQNEPISLQNEFISLQNEPVGLQNEFFSLQNEPVGLQNESLSLQNEPIGLQNEPISLQNESGALNELGNICTTCVNNENETTPTTSSENTQIASNANSKASNKHKDLTSANKSLDLDFLSSFPQIHFSSQTLFSFKGPLTRLSSDTLIKTLNRDLNHQVPSLLASPLRPSQFIQTAVTPSSKRLKLYVLDSEECSSTNDGSDTINQSLPTSGASEGVLVVPQCVNHCSTNKNDNGSNDGMNDAVVPKAAATCIQLPDKKDVASIKDKVSMDTAIEEEMLMDPLSIQRALRHQSLLAELLVPTRLNLTKPNLRLGLSKKEQCTPLHPTHY